ncbi:hypothetical protein KSP39_PZI006186 [Platanthera zijinensis]|uniref:DUF8040 domain-containing protein n=1 Tax=Platanthera zijinensis TaxID=2320716 RepID=A0AAP0BU66_9ASPA
MGKPKDGGISAIWDQNDTLVFCDLCIVEIELGNRPTIHFNKEGWNNLVRGETGLGWNASRKTIDASDEWWDERLKPCMTSKQTGDKWLAELVGGHPVRFHNAFRMSKQIFFDLLQNLEQNYGLQGSRRMASREVLAITLYILSHNETIRKATEHFQHSSETASRYFSEGLRALLRLAEDIIVPQGGYFAMTPPEILQDARYMPFFKDCIGVIDGTHVDARIPVKKQVPYIGRHGTTTQCNGCLRFQHVFYFRHGWLGGICA